MIYPPVLMNIRICDENKKFKLFLPLPLFLLLPLFLFLGVVLLPIALIVTIVFCRKGWGLTAFKAIWHIFKLYCLLHGLSVDIRGKGQVITISII